MSTASPRVSVHFDRPARSSLKRSACDRCRGQKLRCMRDVANVHSCVRCTRANVHCATGPPKLPGSHGRHQSAGQLVGPSATSSSSPLLASPTAVHCPLTGSTTARNASEADKTTTATAKTTSTTADLATESPGLVASESSLPDWSFTSGMAVLDSLFGGSALFSAVSNHNGGLAGTLLSNVHCRPDIVFDDAEYHDSSIDIDSSASRYSAADMGQDATHSHAQPCLLLDRPPMSCMEPPHPVDANADTNTNANASIRLCQLNLALSQQLQLLASQSWDDALLSFLGSSDDGLRAAAQVGPELSPAAINTADSLQMAFQANPLGHILSSTSEFLGIIQQYRLCAAAASASASASASTSVSTSVASSMPTPPPLSLPMALSSSSPSTVSASPAAPFSSLQSPSACFVTPWQHQQLDCDPPAGQYYHHHHSHSMPSSLGMPATLGLLACYLHLLAIYEALFSHVAAFLSRLPPASVSVLQTLPGLRLAGFPVHHGGLQIKILVQVMEHQLDMVEQALGLPPQYCVLSDDNQSHSHTQHDQPVNMEMATLLGVVMASDGMGGSAGGGGGGLASVRSIRESINVVRQLLRKF